MEVKDAIKILSETTNYDIDDEPIIELNPLEAEDIISLLQQGEKYKEMWEGLEYEIKWHKPEEPLFTAKLETSGNEEYSNEILDFMYSIKQKYFPQEVKNEFTLDTEDVQVL